MKYESELIKEIVDSRGHDKSSLHYESECIKSWIEEAKGAYPKLCDYQSEWLEYISILDDTGGSEDPEPPIGQFPYETVTTNHTATVNHVVPFEYKSAILKGNTLMNVVTEQGFGGNEMLYEHRFNDNPFQQDETFTVFVVNPDVTVIKVGLCKASTGSWLREQQYNIDNNKRVVYTVPSGDYCCKYVGVIVRTANDSSGFENSLVIVSGDKSNLEIDNYFEGMLSVQMPVLTTTGKNLFVKSKLNGGQFTTFNGKNVYKYLDGSTNFSYIGKFENNTQYTISLKIYRDDVDKDKQAFIVIHYSDETTTQKIISPDKLAVFTSETGKTIKKITGGFGYNITVYIDLDTTQIEKGTQVSSYEPFKSNILTVNEDVTLRSNGDICDEINLLTGQLAQRIGEDGAVLSQEVIKTVDITIVNQDEEPLSKIKPMEGTMHVTVSGTPINPTAVLEVPVEAITQNLASFIGEE